jgi:hypothetical protein
METLRQNVCGGSNFICSDGPRLARFHVDPSGALFRPRPSQTTRAQIGLKRPMEGDGQAIRGKGSFGRKLWCGG